MMVSEPDVTVVLSSTWRCDPAAMSLILDEFAAYGSSLGSIKGFPLVTDPSYHFIRQHEIHKYVSDHSLLSSPFIVVDDDESCWSDPKYAHVMKGRVVKCDSQRGLTMRAALAGREAMRAMRG